MRSLAGLALVLGVALLSMALFGLTGRHRRHDPLESAARGSFVLGSFVRDWFYWFIRPWERASLALGLGPLFYNLAGVFFGGLAGVFFAFGWMATAGWCVFLGGAADVLDGRIARARGLASPKGAFLDSTLDRFAEVGAFVGLAVWFGESSLGVAVVAAALGGSLLVSYARARGESQGVVCKVGVLQRAERLLLLGFGGILDPAVSGWLGREAPGGLLLWVLAVVAVGTLGTAVYRTVWIAQRLPDADPGPPRGPPGP